MATATRSEAAERMAEAETPAQVLLPIPPLRNGDYLTRPEFERRYDAMPGMKKAELIDGIVYIPSPDYPSRKGFDPNKASPVSHRGHSHPHFKFLYWLGLYWAETPGTEGGDNGSIRLDLDNMPQPDVYLLISPDHGGQARIDEDDYVAGAPELVAEVAFSSVSKDLHAKLETYRRHGAKEYLVWRIEDRAIDWFVLRDGRFERLAPGADGWYRSETFPGLWLDPAALIRGDRRAIRQAVQQGTTTPEHAAFVARLRQAAAPQPPQAPAP